VSALATGIVHFGPGAFHRAHQADYVQRLLGHDPRWGIAAVSLRSAGTVDALRRQQGRYTLAILDAVPAFRTIRAHRRFLGPGDGAAVRALLADPAIRIVTSTVTEKGYCLAGDGSLDFGHPDIVHDRAQPHAPRSLIGWLALGLADRRAAGVAPFTTLCCDNMAGNGDKLRAAVRAFTGAELADEARFPNTMVDSITPATDEALRRRVREATGFADAVPVAREAYSAWVIEDALPPGGPDFAAAGATITADVAIWEQAKLRMLNGAHSALAYLGLLRGHGTVADAMADPWLAGFAAAMLRDEVVPTLRADFDLGAYAAEILARFRNPAIRHRLTQIAWDGSQKLPYRLLDTIADCRAAGRPFSRLALAVAAWMRFVQRAGAGAVDSLAASFAALPTADEALLDRLLGLRQVFPAALAADAEVRAAFRAGLAALEDKVHA
jgi:fructuronate reductase